MAQTKDKFVSWRKRCKAEYTHSVMPLPLERVRQLGVNSRKEGHNKPYSHSAREDHGGLSILRHWTVRRGGEKNDDRPTSPACRTPANIRTASVVRSSSNHGHLTRGRICPARGPSVAMIEVSLRQIDGHIATGADSRCDSGCLTSDLQPSHPSRPRRESC